MSIPIYTPTNKILHEVKVDFLNRGVPSIVHLVQGDNSLPVLEIFLYKGSARFNVTDLNPTEINVRCKNYDRRDAYTPVNGVNDLGNIVYLEIPENMTNAYGTSVLVVEVKICDFVMCSAPFHLEIDRNPVWGL